MTGSTRAKPPLRTQPRMDAKGPARDNPIAEPRTGTTRNVPGSPAAARARGRHHEPGSQPASTSPAQPPRKSSGVSPW